MNRSLRTALFLLFFIGCVHTSAYSASSTSEPSEPKANPVPTRATAPAASPPAQPTAVATPPPAMPRTPTSSTQQLPSSSPVNPAALSVPERPSPALQPGDSAHEALDALTRRVAALESDKASLEQRLRTLETKLGLKAPLPENLKLRGGSEIPASKGSYELYHWWSTTCAPCREELKELISFTQVLKKNGVRVQMFAEEEPDSLSSARAMFSERGGHLGMLRVLVSAIEQNNLRASLNVPKDGSLPVTLLRSPNGAALFLSHKALSSADRERILGLVQKGDARTRP